MTKEDKSVELDQNSYVDKLKEVDIIDNDEERYLNAKEKKLVRAEVGEILWLSLLTPPD